MSFFKQPLVGYAILVVGILLAVYFYSHSVNDNLRDGLLSSCERVNILRAQSNLSDTVSWSVLSSAAEREQALIKKDPDAAPAHRKSADALSNQSNGLTVTGMTDCKAAVSRPRTYNIPQAIYIDDLYTPEAKVSPEAQKVINASRKTLSEDG